MTGSSNVPDLTTSVDSPVPFSPTKYPEGEQGHYWRTIQCLHRGCGHFIAVPKKCRNRFCLVCKKKRRMDIRRRLEHLARNVRLKKYQRLKLLTLTIKNDKNVKKQTSDLLKAFRKMRGHKWWKYYVDGGVYVLEIKKGSQGWHSHIHLILQSDFIPLDKLRSSWKKVSGGTHVNLETPPALSIVYYVTKYISKQDSVSCFVEPAEALKGSRLFSTFGEWYAITIKYKQPEWTPVCPECGQASRWTEVAVEIAWVPDYPQEE